jgi:thioredoxin 1
MGSNSTANPGALVPEAYLNEPGQNTNDASVLYDSDPRAQFYHLRRQNAVQRQPIVLDGMVVIPPVVPTKGFQAQDVPPPPPPGPHPDKIQGPGGPQPVPQGDRKDLPPPPPVPAPWPNEVTAPIRPRPAEPTRVPDAPHETVTKGPTDSTDSNRPRRFSWPKEENAQPAWDDTAAQVTRPNHHYQMRPRDVRPGVPEVNRPRVGQAEHLTDQNFNDKVLAAQGPVLVEFTQPGCGPCITMGPVVDRLAQQYAGKAAVYKVDVSQYPDLAAQYRVGGTPTMLVFDHGQVVGGVSGAVQPSRLTGLLDRQLNLRPVGQPAGPPESPLQRPNDLPQRRPNELPPSPPHSPLQRPTELPQRRPNDVPPSTPDTQDGQHHGPLERIKRFIDRLRPFSRREKEAAMSLTPYEQEAMRCLNAKLEAKGLPPLEFDPRLKLAALKKAEYANERGLTARNNLHYSGPEGFNSPQRAFAQVGYSDYRECADTLSGGTYERNFGPANLINDWWRSRAHREILTSGAEVAGIAVVGTKAYIMVSNKRNFRGDI